MKNEQLGDVGEAGETGDLGSNAHHVSEAPTEMPPVASQSHGGGKATVTVNGKKI
jgi:hypothetical protein